MKFVVEKQFRFVVNAEISFGDGDWFVEVDGKLSDDSRVIVIWNLPFLSQFDLIKLNGV